VAVGPSVELLGVHAVVLWGSVFAGNEMSVEGWLES